MALRTLRARVDEAAGILGLRFASFKEVRLNGVPPRPMPQRRAMPMAASVTPPVAQAQDVDIDATVEADAILR